MMRNQMDRFLMSGPLICGATLLLILMATVSPSGAPALRAAQISPTPTTHRPTKTPTFTPTPKTVPIIPTATATATPTPTVIPTHTPAG